VHEKSIGIKMMTLTFVWMSFKVTSTIASHSIAINR